MKALLLVTINLMIMSLLNAPLELAMLLVYGISEREMFRVKFPIFNSLNIGGIVR